MSYSKLVYHLMFSTHARERTIEERHDGELYSYLVGIVKNLGGFTHAINGMPDHVHIILEMPVTISVSDCVKTIKQHSSVLLADNPHFPRWEGWAKGYAAYTCSLLSLESVLRYVNGQKEHHKKTSFEAELKCMLASARIPYNEYEMK